jgi:hypothetical protein
MLLKLLIAAHRWLGVALCLLFLLWFPSGIGMMYWGMPSIGARDRLARAPVLDPAAVVLSPQEAASRLGTTPSPADIRLTSFDGRPAYRTGGGRGGGGGRIVFADTGEAPGPASSVRRNRAVEAWTGMPASEAVVERVTAPDQWTVGNQLRSLRPLWKYSWPNGEQVYIGESGEVLLNVERQLPSGLSSNASFGQNAYTGEEGGVSSDRLAQYSLHRILSRLRTISNFDYNVSLPATMCDASYDANACFRAESDS